MLWITVNTSYSLFSLFWVCINMILFVQFAADRL